MTGFGAGLYRSSRRSRARYGFSAFALISIDVKRHPELCLPVVKIAHFPRLVRDSEIAGVRKDRSFAPMGLASFIPGPPTANAVGCILSPLCGWCPAGSACSSAWQIHFRHLAKPGRASLGDSRRRLPLHKLLDPHEPVTIQATAIFSSVRRLSASSVPVSSNEFVNAAFPFSTLVMT